MCALVEPNRARRGWRVALLGLATAGMAGCSADAVRFTGDNSLSNPYQRTASAYPGQPPVTAAPVARIESQPLPPPQMAAHPPVSGAAPYYGQGDVTGSVGAPRAGTPVTLEQGDTVDAMARRYGVPVAAILQANNLRSTADVRPGQQILIPNFNPSATPRVVAQPAPPRQASIAPQARPAARSMPAARPMATPVASTHTVQTGDTLSSLGRRYGKSRDEIARANGLPADSKLRIGQALRIPGVHREAAARPAAPQSTPAKPAPAVVAEAKKPAPAQKVAATEPSASARMVAPETAADPDPSPETTGGASLSRAVAMRSRSGVGAGGRSVMHGAFLEAP